MVDDLYDLKKITGVVHLFIISFQAGTTQEQEVNRLKEELSLLTAANKDLYQFAVKEILNGENKIT